MLFCPPHPPLQLGPRDAVVVGRSRSCDLRLPGSDASRRHAEITGGDFEVLEGDWRPHRLALFRFPNRGAIHNFFADPDYAELKALRQRTANSDVVIVDGVD